MNGGGGGGGIGDNYIRMVGDNTFKKESDRCESLDRYFSQLRERIKSSEQDYPRLASVVKGETTLEEIAKEHETRFYQLLNNKTVLLDKFRIRRLQDEVVKYSQELDQFTVVLEDISGNILGSSFGITDSYRNQISAKFYKGAYYGKYTAGFVMILASLVVPAPLWPLWLLLWGGGLGLQLTHIPSRIKPVEKQGKDYAKSFFEGLKGNCMKLDKDIRSAYALDYFMTDRELFKDVYNALDEPVRSYVNAKLTEMLDAGALDVSASQLDTILKECLTEEE